MFEQYERDYEYEYEQELAREVRRRNRLAWEEEEADRNYSERSYFNDRSTGKENTVFICTDGRI